MLASVGDSTSDTCPVCGSDRVAEIRCKVICQNCKTILQSCADLGVWH